MPTTHYPLPTRRPNAAPYTPQQRAEMAAAFKAAKPYLDEHGFICCALTQAGSKDLKLKAACQLAEREVMSRLLPGAYTVASWLVNQGALPANSEMIFDLLLPYRHRWLDSLIAEFSTP